LVAFFYHIFSAPSWTDPAASIKARGGLELGAGCAGRIIAPLRESFKAKTRF
jgi:hypothetical protein